MYEIHDAFPILALFIIIDAGAARTDAAVSGDYGHLGKDQACPFLNKILYMLLLQFPLQ